MIPKRLPCAGHHNPAEQLRVGSLRMGVVFPLGGGKHVNQHHSAGSGASASAPNRMDGGQSSSSVGRDIAGQPDRCHHLLTARCRGRSEVSELLLHLR